LAKFLHLQVLIWPDLLRNYTTLGAAGSVRNIAFSGSSQRQQRDLGRHADPHREAERSQAPVHIERGFLYAVACGSGASKAAHRQPIKSGDEWRDQPRRTDAVIHDLKFYLAAVRV